MRAKIAEIPTESDDLAELIKKVRADKNEIDLLALALEQELEEMRGDVVKNEEVLEEVVEAKVEVEAEAEAIVEELAVVDPVAAACQASDDEDDLAAGEGIEETPDGEVLGPIGPGGADIIQVGAEGAEGTADAAADVIEGIAAAEGMDDPMAATDNAAAAETALDAEVENILGDEAQAGVDIEVADADAPADPATEADIATDEADAAPEGALLA